MNNLQKDKKLISILGLAEIRRIICDTDKGMLKLLIRKGENNYQLVLDSVPLPKDVNKEVMELLFPLKPLDVPQVNKVSYSKPVLTTKEIEEKIDLTHKSFIKTDTAQLHPGRPKGSKNKVNEGKTN